MSKDIKIISLEDVADKVAELKASGSRVVMCHGVFDLMHLGHICHFEQARAYGDALIVTITPDKFVNKGVHRPVFTDQQRAETIAALSVVDYVAINRWPTVEKTIGMIKPDIYCKGGEFKELDGEFPVGLQAELDEVENIGGRVEFTDENLFSSSNLINNHFSIFSPQTESWLGRFREQYGAAEVVEYLEANSKKKVLVIGEAIIDEYVFCEALGKSSKDPILASLYKETEAYAGGSLAVANHLAGFCSQVGLVTLLGENQRREDFIKGEMAPGVKPVFLTRPGATTICKRRFVDSYTSMRLFELYVMDDEPLVSETEKALLTVLRDIIADYDLVVVVDYGHGMQTSAIIDFLCSSAPFLVVNTQANAGNRGFNTISRYSRVDYVCLAMHEIALETRMRHADWKDLVIEVAKRIDCSMFTVTWGDKGSLHYDPSGEFVEVPAFASRVKDRVGAGDAVLALTSLLVSGGAPWEIVGFLGNIAGAQMVGDLGNRTIIDRDMMMRNINSLMK